MNLFINSSKDFLDRTFGEWISHDLLLSILGFFGSLLILTALKSLLNRIVQKKEFKSKVLFNVLLNWIYLVAAFVLISVYFSESSLLNITVFTLGEAEITILLLLIVVFIIIFSLKFSDFVRTYIFPTTFNKYQLDIGTQFTFSSIFHYFILVIAIFISLNTLGINITSLTVFAGVIGVGIGFGMQNIVSNFISGIILLFERPIKVGDRVVLDDIFGDIVEIKIRATVVRTVDNEHIIVPNSFFLEERIINRSYGDLRIRITIDVGVSYSSDVKLVEKLLFDSVQIVSEKTGFILDDPEPLVRFIEFGESSLDFKLFVWVDTPTNVFLVRSELHFEILDQFRQHQVEIPFPQRDVNMKKDT